MGNILNIYDRTTGKYVGIPSIKGESAYEIAVRHGYEGTEEEWINSMGSGEASRIYKWSTEEKDGFFHKTHEHFESYKPVVLKDIELPELPTYEGGTNFYVQPTVLINGDTEFYKRMPINTVFKEYGFETDDVYNTSGKLYIDNFLSWNGECVSMNDTKAGTLEDYLIYSIVSDDIRKNQPAKILFHEANGGKWFFAEHEDAMRGVVDTTRRAWIYPAQDFEISVNGEYKPTTITVHPYDDTYNNGVVSMVMITQVEYDKLWDISVGLSGDFDRISTSISASSNVHRISTEGYENGYLVVCYNDSSDAGLNGSMTDPIVQFRVHNEAFDYVQYKVWTTNADGTEVSPKYNIKLTTPLAEGECLRFSSEPLYHKWVKRLYNKEEFLNFEGVERFTGEYDADENPIFKKTLRIPAATKSTTTTINRYISNVKHDIKDLIKFYEIMPTWYGTLTAIPQLVYTGNCFALDETAKNHGVYQTSSNGLDCTKLSSNYLQVYPSSGNIVVDRGCNVWFYDCEVVLRYTRELTEEDYLKYHF